MAHMRSRNAMVGGDPIVSKKLEIQPIVGNDSEQTDFMQAANERIISQNRKEFKDKYERGLMQKELERYRDRERALGGSKKVSNKIKRRAKVKKAVDDAIIFLGSS